MRRQFTQGRLENILEIWWFSIFVMLCAMGYTSVPCSLKLESNNDKVNYIIAKASRVQMFTNPLWMDTSLNAMELNDR